ncbi:flagellar basal-body rod protein FlgF [Treponema phagedenis]|uniref:Flagellar basal-body rod protein FlgF n=1 Tax=Treponema phagedenis TaxID=162 RepID=A0A0B7GY87_TREPH|nr:flagellar basal-body rod protein FlgF [Treponema phagedenis]EFW38680.1 putative flagellar basal-body rod protein FlgF [Treponema phagedenis F0421]NVP23305.1 flagellar basal-body rod protein FlgF [Treponema phagedenis]QEJ94912.1 flagellar basal-body rod protein FlgF [Treponema phagedenis]QEJ97896.1 flagellar basal-body rod protein FlgF [Treponema phagedenis]QEK00812.1 flagellar basal-body rod protein FlgF [Treponema phagedenis]
MIRGWYTAASGMNAQQQQLDVISNNLANVDTTSYKRDVTINKNFPELLLRRTNDDGVIKNPFGSSDAAPIIGKLGLGVEVNEVFTEFEQGSLKQTHSPSDIALEGKGFFAVQTPQREEYTRNGNFLVGVEGYLMTKEGYPVLGENGRIFLQDMEYKINQNGEIYARPITEPDTDAVFLDRLKIVTFENDRYLQKKGSSFYLDTPVSGPAIAAEGPDRPVTVQGFIEASNVNVVNEMVRMIEVNRAYEANQKTIQSEDTMMAKLWNEVVRVK